MKKKVEFYMDAATGTDCVLQVAMSGTKDEILKKLKGMISEMESPYGKPYQGCASSFGLISHVITPVWNGKEY